MDRLIEIMSRLRSENGCPWDREQTLESLKPFLIEECHEAIDAIDLGDPGRHMDELGDVLLQVLFQAQIRKEQGLFSFRDVERGLEQKLIRRHPHVFGKERASTPREVLKRWEEIKAREKKAAGASVSPVDGVPRSLPALLKAQRVQGRAARVGFDWKRIEDVLLKVEEEIAECREALASGDPDRLACEIGDLLFAVVNFSRFAKADAETALDRAVTRFSDRFRRMEAALRRRGLALADCSPEEMDRAWEAAKRAERARLKRRKVKARAGA